MPSISELAPSESDWLVSANWMGLGLGIGGIVRTRGFGGGFRNFLFDGRIDGGCGDVAGDRNFDSTAAELGPRSL